MERGASIEAACAVVGISERTYQRWSREPTKGDLRRGPLSKPRNALSPVEEAAVLQLVNSPDFRNLSPEQVVAKAAEQGRYLASDRTIRRLLKRSNLATRRQRTKPPTNARPRALIATGPLQVLTWDITHLRNSTIRGAYFYLYLFQDVWSRQIVGAEVHEQQSADLAASALQRVCSDHRIDAATAALHSDNGAPMKGATMLATMQALGIAKSFSRPGVSDDNPFIESLFSHLKYSPLYPSKGFASLQEARAWVVRFVHWYNHQHLHSSIALVTPAQRHDGRDLGILETRRRVYQEARAAHPERWSGQPRQWRRPPVVVLNPDRTVETTHRLVTTAA